MIKREIDFVVNKSGERVMNSAQREHRRLEVRRKYPCIANCEQCGQCAMFHGHDAETAFADYIDGKCSFEDVVQRYRPSALTHNSQSVVRGCRN